MQAPVFRPSRDTTRQIIKIGISKDLLLCVERGVRHAFKSRTLWLKSVFKTQNSFQNTKSVFKTQNQFSKCKSNSQNTNHRSNTQNQFSNRKYIQLQISKTSFSIGYE